LRNATAAGQFLPQPFKNFSIHTQQSICYRKLEMRIYLIPVTFLSTEFWAQSPNADTGFNLFSLLLFGSEKKARTCLIPYCTGGFRNRHKGWVDEIKDKVRVQ